jgi:hypothetical protein
MIENPVLVLKSFTEFCFDVRATKNMLQYTVSYSACCREGIIAKNLKLLTLQAGNLLETATK